MVRPSFSRVGRFFSPTTLVLAGLCLVLPFVTVACDTPGGYGRAAPGGTTTYTGIDLIIGGSPDVAPPDKALPAAQAREDKLPPQPAAIVVAFLLLATTVIAMTFSDRRVRRSSVAMLSAVAATALLVNQALVESEIALRVGEQVAQPLPAGKTIRDFVHTGAGFGLCLLLLLLVALVNAIGWWRARPKPALVAEGSG